MKGLTSVVVKATRAVSSLFCYAFAMSNATYDQYWVQANTDLAVLAQTEATEGAKVSDEREPRLAHFTNLYVKYVQIYNRLEASYDQHLHPQKRRVIHELLLSIIGRILEIKKELTELEASTFFNTDTHLVDLKLNPSALTLSLPLYFQSSKNTHPDLASVTSRLAPKSLPYQPIQTLLQETIPIDTAILIIQRNERGRQGKLRFQYMRDIHRQAVHESRQMDGDQNDVEMDVQTAAKEIQRIARGFLARRRVKKMRADDMMFLKMKQSGEIDAKKNPIVKADMNRRRRKVVQSQYEDEYQAALVSMKEKITQLEGPEFRESMQDSFRQWYMEVKRRDGKFPDFPEDETFLADGFRFDTAPPDTAASQNDSKSTAKKKGSDEGEDEKPPTFLEAMEKNIETFKREWELKDESENFAQHHDNDIIKKDKRAEMEREVKAEMLEALKDELKNLKATLEKDKATKGKKGKGGKDKKGKGGKKGKKEKDLTANRTTESLIEELVQAGVIQKCDKVQFSDILGEHTFVKADKTAEYGMADVVQILTTECILPLGYDKPCETLPIPKSVLLFGPKGNGKTMLVNAVATHLNATVFNISPKNIEGQYTGKANTSKLFHMVFKLARVLAPSIVYISDVDRVFAKKVPKEDTSDPKRLKKDLTKYLKQLSPTDRTMVIGTSSRPFESDAKALVPVFERHIEVPKPDYASRVSLWNGLIKKQAGSSSQIHVSALARLSDGNTAGEIAWVANKVLTERRVRALAQRPLREEEFVKMLSFLPPINQDDVAAMKDFASKLPLSKKREELLGAAEEVDANADKNKKKSK